MPIEELSVGEVPTGVFGDWDGRMFCLPFPTSVIFPSEVVNESLALHPERELRFKLSMLRQSDRKTARFFDSYAPHVETVP